MSMSCRRMPVLAVLCLLLVLLAGTLPARERTMGLILRDSLASEGYTLFAPMSYRTSYLIDMDGNLVNSWTGSYRPGLAVYLEEDGLLTRTCDMGNIYWNSGGRGGRVQLVDWEGNVVSYFDYSSSQYCQHHDVERLPNGNVLMVAWEKKTAAEAIAAGRNPQRIYDALWPEHIIEVDMNSGTIVWEWHVWDHLIQDYDSTKPNYGDPGAHPELIDLNFVSNLNNPRADWLHMNTVAYNPELDQLFLSSREWSEIWIIDHSTTTEEARGHTGGRYGRGGDLLYRWGNPRAYRRGTEADQKLFGQHDVQWIPSGLPGAGNVLVFNNGPGRAEPPFSTIEELVLPEDSAGFYHLGPDSAYGPAGPVWTYQAPEPSEFYSGLMSGCQRLPNGNTLICQGEAGKFFEVTESGQLVWVYINPVSPYGPMQQGSTIPPGWNQVFKVRRYPPDYPAFVGRNMDPQGPIEIYPQGLEGDRPPTVTGINLQVGPSPVRRTAQVSLTLNAAGPVRLDVFNTAGRRVANLANGHLPAGTHLFRWDCGSAPEGAFPVVCRTQAGTLQERITVVR
ncbi:MAG: aryl-sulfate sulfotransferase [candidate division WOR-3 bacterium]